MRSVLLASALAAFSLLLVSCAPTKAGIDYAMSEGIVWPGPPEKPRVKYLWSLRRISGAGETGGFLSVLAGDPNISVEDPRQSDYLVKPHGVYVDDNDILYITDTGAARVSVVDLKTMESFNIEDIGDASLSSPIGVVADARGRIYVSDADLKAVGIYGGDGRFLGLLKGKFNRPTGLAVNSEKELLYVSDSWDHRVYIYGMDGEKKGEIGGRGEGPGELNYPTHICVDSRGFIFVADTLNFRVQVFDPEGNYVSSFGLLGDSYDTFDKIKGIAVDSERHIYISDSAQDMVKIYDVRGRMLLFFGRKGAFYGMFSLPEGIYVDQRNRIFVADSLNGRVQAFQFLGGG